MTEMTALEMKRQEKIEVEDAAQREAPKVNFTT